MKRVGIITPYGNDNYGNRLQNYALQEILKKQNLKVESLWSGSTKERVKVSIQNILYPKMKNKVKDLGRNRKCYFVDFTQKYIKTRFLKDVNRYDYFIVGSDQVWNWNHGLNLDMYLPMFSPKEKNISYAASFGLDYIKEDLKETYKQGLNNFNYISVREDKGKELVKELIGRTDAEVLVDPTMLLTEEEWNKVMKKPVTLKSKKYILNYFLGELSSERKEEIERIAKENDCDIINILDKDGPFYATGPSEFLYLEKNAFLICTDSFHSCVFAILFNRPFIIFDREDKEIKMNSRIETLINKFELKNRKYEGKITKENINHDYTKAYKILEKEREKSIKYLEKSLNISRE